MRTEAVATSEDAKPTEPPPPAATFPVAFHSEPWRAEVFIDGKSRGLTPLLDIALEGGAHQVRLQHGTEEIQGVLHVGPRKANKLSWNTGEQAWVLEFSSP